MKVLEILGEPVDVGGQESFVFHVLEHMDRTGIQIDVLTPYHWANQKYKDSLQRSGGKAIAFNLPMKPGKSRHDVFRPLKRYLTENPYDAVHIHSGSTSVLGICSLAARKAGVRKIIVHSHCAADKVTMKYRLARMIMTPVLDRCPTHYCACSRLAGEWKFSPQAMKKLLILKNGVELDRFRFRPEGREEIRRKLGIMKDGYVIGHVGRFNYQKNQEFLLNAFARYQQEDPKAVLLYIGEGEFEDRVRERARELGLADRVLFCGTIENVEDYYSAMDVFALPSHYEGLPVVGVEAQASGLPVLVSDQVSEELAITDQVTYIPLKEEAWVEGLRKVCGMPRADSIARIIREGYDLDTTAKTMKELYLS